MWKLYHGHAAIGLGGFPSSVVASGEKSLYCFCFVICCQLFTLAGMVVDGWMDGCMLWWWWRRCCCRQSFRCSSWFPTKARFDTPFCVGFFLWDSFTRSSHVSFSFYLCGPFFLSLVTGLICCCFLGSFGVVSVKKSKKARDEVSSVGWDSWLRAILCKVLLVYYWVYRCWRKITYHVCILLVVFLSIVEAGIKTSSFTTCS